MQIDMRRQNLSQANLWQSESYTEFQELIELLSNTDDLDLLVKIFSNLGARLLKQNRAYDRIIKCDALYQKITLLLKCGLQRKLTIALYFISALLSLDNEEGLTKRKALQIYAKNMIRVSGCLGAMTEIFTSFMMCIQRYRQGNLDPILVLQSLLSKHQDNMKLFHEINGMSIFTRESVQNTACLQLLNLIIENTKHENHSEILKASHLFRELRHCLHKYGLNSSVGQWASIVLFSQRKVLGTDPNGECNEEYGFKYKNNEMPSNSLRDIKYNNTDTYNETNELLGNVFREALGCQNQFRRKRFRNSSGINRGFEKRTDMQDSYENLYKKLNKTLNKTAELEERNNIYDTPTPLNIEKDMSFTYLRNSSTQQELGYLKPKYNSICGQHGADNVETSTDTPNFHLPYNDAVFDGSIVNNSQETVLCFNPQFVSTPKCSKSNSKLTSRTNGEIAFMCSARRHIICNKTIDNRKKFTKTTPANKNLRKMSMSAKFFDIINGSCTTLINGFKTIFNTKKNSDQVHNKSKENNSCSYSFTNYMFQRDALLTKRKKDKELTHFTRELSLSINKLDSCNTCNDTFILKYKMANDAHLQQTVKRLKQGINLYGCDFKKISRTMWPQEKYMTPSVLYNLYRKLIIRQ